jgi:GNAT superfamily N-acetyltransferase
MKYVKSGTSWVAEAEQQIVGFLYAEWVMRDLHVWEMAVRYEWQGRGIGRQLMNATIDYAYHNRLKSVTLTTFRVVPWNEPFTAH